MDNHNLDTLSVSFQVKTTMSSDTLFDIICQFVTDHLPADIETYDEHMLPNDAATLCVGPAEKLR